MHRVEQLVQQLNNSSNNNNNNDTIQSNNTLSQSQQQIQQSQRSIIGRTSGIGSELVNNVNHSLRWDGWGYQDTSFYIDHKNDALDNPSQVQLLGSRYLFSGKTLPSLRSWMEATVGINVNDYKPGKNKPTNNELPKSIINQDFIGSISGSYKRIDYDGLNRLYHSHGHTAQEIYTLRYGSFERIVDVVIYPDNKQQVQHIIQQANKHNVVIIPYGGGTSVSQALLCNSNEQRMIVSLDLHALNTIELHRYNMTATIGAGCVGKDIENYLHARGLTLGHEPDSSEFSTLGGWIATRASGMKKNKYGNIDDIIITIECITPTGTLYRNNITPRVSHGPDLNHIILGSEGIYGVIVSATVRIRPLPKHTHYGSIVFPNFDIACQFMYNVQLQHLAPVSIRLVDNMQFQFGLALKPPTNDWFNDIKSKLQKYYITQHLKFDPQQICAATLLFEDDNLSVIKQHESKLIKLASKYGGISGGSENGIRGYFLTYMIAYLRDFGINYNFIAESFETAVQWEYVETVCNETKQNIIDKASQLGVKYKPFVSCRVTQLYDAGACIYTYFGFITTGLNDPIDVFNQIEHSARDVILQYGGSLSHHHGIGKLRRYGLQRVIGERNIQLLKSIKKDLDPNNILASGNLIEV